MSRETTSESALKELESLLGELYATNKSRSSYGQDEVEKLDHMIQIINDIEKDIPNCKPALIEAERLTEEILDVILALSALDFSKAVNVGYEDSNFNAVATGLNMLGQELQRSVVSKEALEREIVQRKNAEQKLQEAHDFLEEQVEERTRELLKTNEQLKIEVEERRKAEEEVRKRELKYRNIFETTTVSMWEEDARPTVQKLKELKSENVREYLSSNPNKLKEVIQSMIVLDVNDATLKMFEANSKTEIMENIDKTFCAESTSTFLDICSGLVEGKTSIERETIFRTLKGNRINVLLQLRHDPQSEAANTIISIVDITDQRELEQQLRQSQKMEAIGRLAGGVAHDFNNLLTVILSYGQMLVDEIPKNSPTNKKVAAIVECAERAASLTKQLLAFSRRQVIEPKTIILNDILSKMEKMFKRLLGEDVELITNFSSQASTIKADEGQMEQIVMNLVVNARDAMPKGGKLTVETQNVKLHAEYPRHQPGVKTGNYLMLAVTDTGHGMTDEVRSRIFEPFFTTKEVGKGTGLGLSTVYGIVTQNNGNIFVYSEVDHGTTFKLYFPVANKKQKNLLNHETENKIDVGDETILVVEDEHAVRKVACTILQENGYHVLQAKNGKEALEIAQNNKCIDMMLTDVIMPGMDGSALTAKLRSRRPDLKVLFMSGYTDNAVLNHEILKKGTPFLQKPFTPKVLLARIRSILDLGDESSKPT